MRALDAVVATGGYRHLVAALLAGQLQQAYVQVSAGVQGDHAPVAAQVAGAVFGEHILSYVGRG